MRPARAHRSDTVKALTLSAEAVSKLAPTGVSGFSIDEFQRHATLVAQIAAAILPKSTARQDAITAGLLHDIGQLIAIADSRQHWQRLSDEAQRRQLPLHLIEHETQGITHAATGAYLLSLWGLPDGVVEAVAHHHNPLAAPGAMLDAVAAVHIAEALADEAQQDPDRPGPPPLLDETYIEQLGVGRQLDQWRKLAHQAANASS